MDSTHARDNEDLQLHLLKSFHGNGAPWSLYTRAGRFPLGDPPPMQSNKTNYWEVRRRVSLLVPGIALWAQSHFGSGRAKSVCTLLDQRLRCALRMHSSIGNMGGALIRCGLTDRLDPIKQAIGQERSRMGDQIKTLHLRGPVASE